MKTVAASESCRNEKEAKKEKETTTEQNKQAQKKEKETTTEDRSAKGKTGKEPSQDTTKPEKKDKKEKKEKAEPDTEGSGTATEEEEHGRLADAEKKALQTKPANSSSHRKEYMRFKRWTKSKKRFPAKLTSAVQTQDTVVRCLTCMYQRNDIVDMRHTCTPSSLCANLQIYLQMGALCLVTITYTFENLYAHTSMHMYMCVCVFVCVYICVYVCVCVCM